MDWSKELADSFQWLAIAFAAVLLSIAALAPALVLGPSAEVAATMTDKWLAHELFEERGIASPRSWLPADVPADARYPLLVNMLTGGKTPILPAAELEGMGYKIVVAPIESLLVTAKAFMTLAETFLEDGHVMKMQESMLSFVEIKEKLGVDRYLNLRESLGPD